MNSTLLLLDAISDCDVTTEDDDLCVNFRAVANPSLVVDVVPTEEFNHSVGQEVDDETG